jgi:hypothetical protein
MNLQPNWHLIPAIALFLALIYLNAPQGNGQDLQVDLIELPPGFEIDVYAADLPGARSLAQSPGGTIFVGIIE